MEKQYVIAGNYRQFEFHARGRKDWFYISSPEHLHGLRDKTILLIGTYFLRDDWHDLKECMHWMNLEGRPIE
jgi:hypothetical protein